MNAPYDDDDDPVAGGRTGYIITNDILMVCYKNGTTRPPPHPGVQYVVNTRRVTMEEHYNTWVDTRQPPLFGKFPDCKVVDTAATLGPPKHAPILDVGAGDSRLAQRLQEELLRSGLQVKFVALDRRITHLRNGHPISCTVPAVVADVFNLPFGENSFDVVMCNLFLHHFSGQSALNLLRRMAEVARDAVIVNDLERNLLPYLFIRVAFPLARSRITRFDGPASVRQAYTRGELRQLAESAGFRNFEVERMGAYRLGMTIWKGDGGARA